MGIFNEQSFDHPFARGIQDAAGVGFNLTSSGDDDMINKKLRNQTPMRQPRSMLMIILGVEKHH